jgi:hypothetical protein
LEKGGEVMVNLYVEEITYLNRVYDLIRNNYGNYVIQKALQVSPPMSRFKLVNNIMQNLFRITDKKLMLKWKLIVDSNIQMLIKQNFISNNGILLVNENLNQNSFPQNNFPNNYNSNNNYESQQSNQYITPINCTQIKGKLFNNTYQRSNNVHNFNFNDDC